MPSRMIQYYRVYLANLSFFFLFQLMEIGRHTNELVKKTSRASSLIRSSLLIRSMPNKKPMIVAIEKGKGAKASNSKKCPKVGRRPSNFQFYQPSHAGQRRPQLSLSSG